MKRLKIPKSRIRDFLARRRTYEVLQSQEDELYAIIRNHGILGFEQLSDEELFNGFGESFHHFAKLKMAGADDTDIIIEPKEEFKEDGNRLLVDLKKIVQLHL